MRCSAGVRRRWSGLRRKSVARASARPGQRCSRAQVLLSVLEKLPEELRRAYAAAPRRLRFGADVAAASEQQWARSQLRFEAAAAPAEAVAEGASAEAVAEGPPGGAAAPGVVLRAVCYERPRGDAAGSGTFCCTLLSETQAFEHILYGCHEPLP